MIRAAAIALGAVLATAALLAGCGGGSAVDPTDYRVEPFSSWPQTVKHKQVDGYVENAWQDPAYTYVVFTVDSRATDETGSPLQNAQLARLQTTKLHGYKEGGMRWIKLGGKPAVRWSFDMGEQANIRWFFEECGVSFVVRGTTGLYGFTELSGDMRGMAATIAVNGCDE